MTELKKASLETLANGAVKELFEAELARVIEAAPRNARILVEGHGLFRDCEDCRQERCAVLVVAADKDGVVKRILRHISASGRLLS